MQPGETVSPGSIYRGEASHDENVAIGLDGHGIDRV
jgi:hypothetical protein